MTVTVKSTAEVKEEHTERMARIARVVSFLDVKSKSRISKEQSVAVPERKAVSTSSATTTKFHMADRLVDALP